jgi:DNA-binding XRE family transcriptional regulator
VLVSRLMGGPGGISSMGGGDRGRLATKPENRPHCPTPLQKWLDKMGTSRASFARLLGANVRTVNLWANGQVMPSLTYAYKIDELTRGEVSPGSWLGTDLGRREWALRGTCNRE